MRLTLLLKLNALARGHSGLRRVTLEALMALLAADALLEWLVRTLEPGAADAPPH